MAKTAAYMRAYRLRKKQPQPVPPPPDDDDQQQQQAPQQQAPQQQTVQDYLGPKGNPENSVQAAANANPYFSQSLQNRDKLYTHNCQRCVWATELRRRGYDVSAMPRTSDNSYAKADPSVPNSFTNGSNPPLDFKYTGLPWQPASATAVKNLILQHGEGSRGALVMAGNSGHVCNWEVKNGKVLIYDGQSNSTHSITSLKKRGMWYFGVARMDNIPDSAFTPLMKDLVRRSSDNAY